jgi:amino acid adenylation domain-containing protein
VIPEPTTYQSLYDGFKLPPDQEAIINRCFHPSGNSSEFPSADVEGSIPARFEKIASLYPDRLAIQASDCALTYAELNRAANRIARAILAKRGTGSEPITLLFEQGAAAIVAILSVLKAGKIYVPLDRGYPPSMITAMLQNSQPQLLLGDDSSISVLNPSDRANLSVLNIENIDDDLSEANLGLPLAADLGASIMYTSGSTGEPKGVIQNHRNILQKVLTETNNFHISVDDRLSLLYSYSFSASVRCIFSALLNGAALVLLDVKREGLARIAERIISDKVSLYFSVPSLFRTLATVLRDRGESSSLRLIYLGSEAVRRGDVDLFKACFSADCILVNSLASGETGTARQYFIDKATEISGDIVPVGFGVLGKQVLVLDEKRKARVWNRPGEIAVKSRFLSPGYWRRPDLTHERFRTDPNDPSERIYFTGDLGLMRSDGCLEYLGRKDFQLRIRGHGVVVGETELALQHLSTVKEAVVVPRENADGEKYLVAYLVPAEERLPTTADLRRALADKLPDYMIPSAFVFLDAVPLTPTGKIDRGALPEPGKLRPSLDTPYVAPQTPVEKNLARLWAEVLSLEKVGIHDNFWDLGGHSLTAARVVSRIIRAFQIEMPMDALFASPTVADMAKTVLNNPSSEEVLDRLLREVEAMSEDDAQTLLNHHDRMQTH